MPITATFTADFTKWNQALRDATASFQPFEVKTRTVQSQLAQMAKSFSGEKIIREAQLAAAALGKVENVTQLTNKEQARLNATVTESIAKYQALGQTVPKELQDIAKATEDAAKATAANANSFKNLVAGYAAGLATFEGAKRVIGGIVDFLESSVDAYAKAEAGQKRLVTALQGTGRATPEVIKQYGDLATEFQRTTTFSDDLITSTEALFTQIGNVGPQDMKTALAATTDLAEGLGIDLEQAATAVAKATEGQTTALHRLAPSLNEATLKGGDLAAIAAEIEQHFGGQAAAALDTYSGHVKQLANDWDNLKEAIGGAIANDPLVLTSFRKIGEGVDSASVSTEGFKKGIFGLLSDLDGINSGLSDFGTTALLVAQSIDLLDEDTKQLNTTFDRLKKQADLQILPKGLENKSAGGMAVFAQLVKDAEAAKKAAEEAARAAAEAAKAMKALRDEISGAKIEEELRQLQKAWEGLTPAEQRQAIAVGIVTEKYVALASRLPSLPPDLRAFAVTMNTAAEATGLMSLKIGELKPLVDSLGPTVDRTAKSFKDWGFEVGFEATIPIINLGKALKSTEGFIDRLPESLEKSAKAAHIFEEAFKKIAEDIPNILVQAFVNHASVEDTVKALGTQIGADLGEAIGTALGGAVGGAIGKALGSLLGPLLGKLIHTRAEQLVDSVAADFGEMIDKKLGQQIEDLAKSQFGGSRQAAQIASLADIISVGGGITTKNLGQLEARLHDVFSLLETGEFNGAQAQKVLNDNFQTFVDFLGGKVNPALKEIIRLNDQFGTQSKAIAQFVDAEANKALDALGKVITARGSLVDQLAAATDPKEIETLQKKLAALPLTAGGAQAEGSALFGIFARLTKDGASFIDTLSQMQPVIDALDKQLTQAGLTGGAAFAQLKSLAGIATDEIAGPAFQAIQSFGAALEGLNNADILDQATFSGLTDQITKTFEAARQALIAEGKDGDAALKLIAPQLQDIWELQQDFGYAVDAATQKLLDQGLAAGTVGEKHRSVMEQTLDVMKHLDSVLTAIGEKFGVTIPSDIDKTGQAFDALGNKIGDAIARIPESVNIPVRFDVPDIPTGRPAAPFSMGGLVPFSPALFANGGLVPSEAMLKRALPVYASSGLVNWTPRGTDNIPAMLTARESVLNVGATYRTGASAINWANAGGTLMPTAGASAGTITISVGDVYLNGRTDRGARRELAADLSEFLIEKIGVDGPTKSKWQKVLR